MSYRKAKQLLEQKKIISQKPTILEEDNQEQETQPAKKPVNMFANMMGENSSSEEEPPKQSNMFEELEKKKESNNGEKKKKKKKKKGKGEKKEEEKQEDEVEKMFKEVGMEYKGKQKEQLKQQQWDDILRINESKFNYEKQLRKHFGRAGTLNEQDKDTGEMTKKQQKMQKHLRKFMKKSILAHGVKEYFPIREKFEIDRNQDQIKVMPTKKYDHYQIQYEAVRNSNDVNALFAFSQTHPEHVDSLYAVGEFLRLQGNYRDADALIQRVIYIYEIAAGYDLQEFIQYDILKKHIVYDIYSTSLFMSVFKLMDILGKKGCFRSALEYNKFLLKINLSDPTACMLCIDFNAISSKSNSFLLKFIKHYSNYIGSPQTNLYLMPNFTYSTALAKFNVENCAKQGLQKLIVEESNMKQLLSFNQQDWKMALQLPNSPLYDEDSARTLLLRAILLYPKLMIQIAQKNEYKKQFLNYPNFVGNQKKTFKEILEHQFWTIVPSSYSYHFLNLQDQQDSMGLDKVLEVYVERSKILWKSNEVMLWVKGAMGYFLNKVDAEEFVYQEYLEKMCTEECGGMPIPFALKRFKNISKVNFSDRVDQIDLANIQDNQHQQVPVNENRMNLEGNAFSLFLNSLLPWVNLPSQSAQQAQFDPDMPDIQDDD